jgi:hypothetical protein
MKEVFSNAFLRYQSELDAEEPEEPGLSTTRMPHDGKRLVTFGRKIMMTAADGDAEQSKLAALSDAGIHTPSQDAARRASPEQEKAKRASERRARMATFRAQYDAQWFAEIQTDAVLEEEFIVRFGPSSIIEGLAYLKRIAMPRCGNNQAAFANICAVDSFKLRFEQALSWCR